MDIYIHCSFLSHNEDTRLLERPTLLGYDSCSSPSHYPEIYYLSTILPFYHSTILLFYYSTIVPEIKHLLPFHLAVTSHHLDRTQ